MSAFDITLQEVKDNFPDAYKKMLSKAGKKLQKSKAKSKGKCLSELKWTINYCEEIDCSGEFDILNIEENTQETLKNSTVWLGAKMPGSSVTSKPFVEIPNLFKIKIRQNNEQLASECRATMNEMDKEENNAEAQRLILELSKSVGFFAV